MTCVRPVLEYSCQVFHFALPAYLSDAIEWVQKHALAIIYPNIDYTDSLDLSGILKLRDRHLKAYDKLFNDIVIGVGLLFKKNLKIKKLQTRIFRSFELMEVLLHTSSLTTRIVVVYRPPPSSINGLTSSLFRMN